MKAKNIIIFLLAISIFIVPGGLSAQTQGSLAGTVFSVTDGIPLPGINVHLDGQGIVLDTATTINGEYSFENLLPGSYNLTVFTITYVVEIYSNHQTLQNFLLGASVPTIQTTLVSNITSNSALSGGTIMDEGASPILNRGVTWSTTPYITLLQDTSESADVTSVYTSGLFSLLPNTTYYVRAFARNSSGYGYGNEIRFTTSPSERTIDSLALVDLYNSTNGPGWTNNSGWLTGPIDSWFGVSLTGDRVTTISLNRNNLVGTIPSSIGDLTELTYLDFWTNGLYGEIPPEIGSLINLTRLYLNINELTGPIPTEVSNLNNLSILYLSGNQLSGIIPPELGNMINLEILSLGQNQLTGTIPAEIGLLINLTELSLNDNQLTGQIPPEIGNLANLEFLILRRNLLTGTIPSQIWNLTNLRQLHVGINNLSGTISTEIGNLINLEFLQLYSNQFTGQVPAEIWNLTSLGFIQLSSNQFTGQIPAEIANLTNLFFLNLGSNMFSGDIPSVITNLSSLRALDIRNNQFTSLPDLSSIPNLDSLHIQNNRLTFKDIEPNIGVASVSYSYSPQDNIVTFKDTTLYLASEMILSVSAGGESSQYQWYKDGEPVGSLTVDSTLAIRPVNIDDAGIYTCEVTNTVATDLTLSANPATLGVINAILVSNTDTTGIGSLRNAIDYANSNPGRDSIIFNIPGPGILHTIQPATPLPVITDPLVIDGYTQPGAEKAGEATPANLLIQLDGINLIDDVWHSGLQISGGNSTVRGLIINQFADGIHIHLNGGNIIEGNYIGVDFTGLTGTPGNTEGAVRIWDCSGNIIGGDLPWQRNIIASESNHNVQILLTGAYDNVVKNNYLGVGIDGVTVLGNSEVGVRINADAHHNTIGPNNIISGHDFAGIDIFSDSSNNNRIIENFIGTDFTGEVSVPNGVGIIISGASNNIIGPGNIISGNTVDGVKIETPGTSSNEIKGNYIGTNTSNSDEIGNGAYGIVLTEGASGNIVGPANVISGNGEAGIHVNMANTINNRIIGNLVGTTIDGMGALGNRTHGIHMNASNNIIGGTSQEERNVISSNGYFGLEIGSNNETGNTVLGNFIGTDITGNGSLLNNAADLALNNASSNIVGGLEPGARNVLGSLNIVNEGAYNNQIIGNYIGLKENGTEPIDNDLVRAGILVSDASNNIIGPANIISGVDIGVFVTEEFGVPSVSTTKNRIIGNYIGTNAEGSDAVSNRVGIQIDNVQGISVGGALESERNVISGNDIGINIWGIDADSNRIVGNYIGTNFDGTGRIPNNNGVWITDGNDNIIGGADPSERNIISGNNDNGIWIQGSEASQASGNKIQGNFIGLTADGLSPLGNNGFGIKIRESNGNLVGGARPEERNIISANGSIDPPRHGIHIAFNGDGPGNIIQGNYVGTDYTGMNAVGNAYIGIVMYYSSNNRIIGNLVSGNSDGIYIYSGPTDIPSQKNIVQGNLIGTDATGKNPLGNTDDGIGIQGGNDNIIGGITPEERNIISGNRIGIRVLGAKASENLIKGNYIGTDVGGESALPNSQHGIYVYRYASNNIIGGSYSSERNIISGNGMDNLSHGIVISDSTTTGNKILGNYIGLDYSGEKALGNAGDGVQVIYGASNNIIGGSNPGERNIISGNGVTGIAIYGNADDNEIAGNYIGLDASGLRNIGHPGGSGVYIGSGSSGNIVGGTEYGAANFIVGNTGWAGIAVEGSGTEYNIFTGNLLGVNAKREGGFGNRVGIRVYNGASNNQIGGTENGEGNLVAFSKEEGILVYNNEGNTDPTSGNVILTNLIHSNGGLGIDLGYDGVTENDEGDTDSSPNNLQNYPVLDSLSFSPGYVTVGGYLNSTPLTEFIIQFFASKVADNSDYGEGQSYLGSETVTTDAGGIVSFVKSYPIPGTSGQVISGTATDPFGNSSEFSMSIGGVKDHILADINRPFYFTVNEDGLPTIYDNSDIEALEYAFQSWTDVSTADIEFISNGTTSLQNASATDGVNLVTFRDEKFPFAPGVLAVSAKTLRIDPTSQVAEIIDADIVFNPEFVNRTEYSFGVAEGENDTLIFDIQSITIHEIGHVLGLIHSGAPLSTMFFVISPGIELRSLAEDDLAWASYRYPGIDYSMQFGSISGRVTYGDAGDPENPETHPPVAGALILAVDTTTKEQIHAYTDADGIYTVPVPVVNGTVGHYWIYIQPLDGDVFGYPLKPGNISSYIYSNTIFTDFPNEWFNGTNESAFDSIDNVTKATVIDVLAGESVTRIDLVTNMDDRKPYVVSVFPSATEYNDSVDVLSDIIIRFSEPVDRNSFTSESCFLEWSDGSMGGDYFLLGDSTHIVIFSPSKPMFYNTEYSLHLTGAITDLKFNPIDLEDEVVTTFKTEYADTLKPVIKDIIPGNGTDSVFVTSEILVFFSEPMDLTTSVNGFKFSSIDNPEIEGSITWNPENTLLTYKPLRSLMEGTEYTVYLSTELADLSGNTIEGDTIITFVTVPEANPEIIYLGPENNSVNVTVETPIVADFSEPVDVNTVNAGTFRLLGDLGIQVDGSFEFLMENSRVVFRPDNKLDYNRPYTIELTSGIYDVSTPSLPLVNIPSAGFTTASEPLMPHILYLEPPAGVTGSIVTIAGSGFDPDPARNIVLFNGTPAQVIKSSLTAITVKVPVGAISGDVTVSVNGQVSNTMYFIVLSQSLDPCEDVTANINTGAKSRDVAVTPDAGLALVTNSESGTVSVIALSLEGLPVIETVKVGEEPMKIDIDGLGKFAYVTNYRSHTVSVIKLDDYSVETIKVGLNPYGVVVAPDGKVYVSNETSQDVSIIDVNPESGGFNHVIANINTGTRNRDIDISPDAGYILVTGDDGLTIISVNPLDIRYNSVIANVNTGTKTRDVEVTPDAAIAFVTTEAGDLFIVDIYPYSDSFGSVIANINTGAKSRDIVISPDALFVYITNEEGSVSVYKIDIGGFSGINASYIRQVTLVLHTIIPAELISAKELEGIVIDYLGDYLYVVNPDYSGGTGQLVQISLCCGPILPEKAIANLIINIQNMLNSGLINEGTANSLITKLNNALKMIDKGQSKAAVNILYAFISEVEDLKDSGDIPLERADAIIYATEAIIFNLKNPPLKSFDMNLQGDEYNEMMKSSIEMLFPNPFNESVSVYFKIQNNSNQDLNVNIRIYNSAGQLVKILTSMNMPVGDYIIRWDGLYDNGQEAPDNVYFIYFKAGDYKEVRKLILQRSY